MEWKKAKSILIIMFFVIDIFLFALNFYSNFGNNNVDYDKLSKILAENNINIEKSIVKKNRKAGFVYEFSSVEIGEDFKKTMLGEYDKTEKGEYVSKNKKSFLSVSGNKISYSNSAPEFNDFKKVNQKNLSSKLKPYIRQLGVQKYAFLENVKVVDGKYIAEYTFKVDNNPLFSAKLEFLVSKDGIHNMEAVLNTPNKADGYKFELSNIETILLNFSRNNTFSKPVDIVEITYGYYISDYENAVVSQALPVYMIKTVNNSYIYDARDGVDSTQRRLAVSKY